MYDRVVTINNTHWPAYGKPGATLVDLRTFDPNDRSSEPRLVFQPEKLRELGIPAALIGFVPKCSQLAPKCSRAGNRPDANSMIRLGVLVGARGFEPRTSCAQGSCKKSILLVRLALFCVVVHGFGPNSAVVGPKLDLTFFSQLGRRQAGAASATYTSATSRLKLGFFCAWSFKATPQTAAMRSSIVSECPVY